MPGIADAPSSIGREAAPDRGEVDQQHAQAGIGHFAGHQHGGGGGLVAFRRDEERARRAAGDQHLGGAFDADLADARLRRASVARLPALASAGTAASLRRARLARRRRLGAMSGSRAHGRHVAPARPARSARREPAAWRGRENSSCSRVHDRHEQQRAARPRRRSAGSSGNTARTARRRARRCARRPADSCRPCATTPRGSGSDRIPAVRAARRPRAPARAARPPRRRRAPIRPSAVEVGDQLLLAQLARSGLRRPGPADVLRPRRGSARRDRQAATAARGCADGCRAASSTGRRCRPCSCTCRSRRRWISVGREHVRERVERAAALQARRARSAAVASAAARLARTRDSSVDSSESCCVASTELFWPISRSDCERKSATFASASLTRFVRSAISGSSQSVASEFDCCLAPR